MSKFLSLLGFSKKAGKLKMGSNEVLRSILSLSSKLVIVNEDSGNSVKEKFSRLCEENDIEYRIYGKSDEFSYATGDKNKVIYSVEDDGFARKLIELMMEVQ